MDRATFKLFMAIGVLLYGALYLCAVVLLGLIMSVWPASLLATAAMGVSYLSYIAHSWPDSYRAEAIAPLLVWLSILLGTGAGLMLLFAEVPSWAF
ncbi:MAG TPA: hypothetical protein VHY10_16270 [Xanthobacteraceae bacterium]|jgi:hypothetical protein|nr:hypothetical protein [Xanthobacteraceae bacterium]